jgi:Putative zinc finger in N-recognin (UBR box)
MNLCIALGRGRVTYDEKKVSVLGDSRLTIYQKIADQSTQRSSNPAWPLWLRPAHRMLLSANLTSEPAPLPTEAARQGADRFIVNGFIAELPRVLDDTSTFSESDPSGHHSSSEDVAVSLHDARIFLTAFGRLSPDEQASKLSSLLSNVDEIIAQMRNVASAEETIGEKIEVPAFVARVITLCVNTYLMVRFGTHARDELNRTLGKSLSSRPPILRSRSEWYFPDTCFMGVFTDWEDSGLPSIPVSPNYVDEKSEKTLQLILENAFYVGFATATTDKCHLLYAAWNALGKCDLWTEIPSKVQQFSALPDDLSLIVLQLRDEICLVQRIIKKVHGEILSGTTLMRVIEEKEKASSQRASAVEVKNLLRGMIKKASKLIDALLGKFVPPDETMDQQIPAEVFCLFEACAVYLSFAISSYTKPSVDFFSSTMLSMTSRARNRARGYSTDSEAVHSEGGSVDSQDALVDTLERLQDVCECLGAVPAHPDWLDKDSRLFETITANEAADAAHQAQVCLTKLISVGLAQAQLLQRRALTSLIGPRKNDGVAVLASTLCLLHHYETDESSFGESPYVNEREYKSDIGKVCEIDPDFLDVLLSDAAGNKRHEAKGTWCPHSAQRVLGRFQDLFRTELVGEVESPELRACGEWEVLLAGTLTSACVHVEPGKRNPDLNKDVYGFVERSERWFGVCWGALDSLVATTALLRFGISTVGRVAHPLSAVETTTDYFESNKGVVVEEMPRDITASKSIEESVILTLATIARFPPSPTCDVIATHLMIDAASFANLQGMEASTSALRALAGLQDSLDCQTEISKEAVPFLVERAAAVLETYGSDGDDGDPNEPRKLSRLYACLRRQSSVPSVRFSTFLSHDVDPSSALSRANAFCDSNSAPDVWDWEGSKFRFTESLLSYILHDCLRTHMRTRGFFARAMSSLVAMEFDAEVEQSSPVFELLSPIICTFNEIPEDTVTDLIRKDICNVAPCLETGVEQPPLYHQPSIQESLCTLFAFLLASQGGCTVFRRAGLVFSLLENAYDEWKHLDLRQRECVMDLTLLYASRSGNLHGIGAKLFEDLKLKQKSKLDGSKAFENLKLFADFLEELHVILSKRSSTSSGSLPTKRTNLPRLPSSCSYAIQKDFHEQHWYNCYTCGLTNDKGCCTLCAIVCHQGHDVSYARYSSFFCDCGGADETSSSDTQQKCKCLSPQTRDKVFKWIRCTGHEALMTKERRGSGPTSTLSAPMCAMIVKSSFAQEGLSAMNGLTEKGRNAGWARFLFECTKKRFDRWKSQTDEASIFSPERCHGGSYGLLSRTMDKALDKPWTLKMLGSEAYSLLGASRSGAFQMKMSTDSTIDRLKRSRIVSNGIVRSAMDADSRGRIAIAEPNGLVFCSGLPVVNSRMSTDSGEPFFSRSSMCIIGSASIGIRIIGMRFARDCENLIYAWGTNEAKVIFMNRGLTAIDFSATLDIGLTADEAGSDIVVNSHWLTGSGTCLVIGCSHYLRVFDITHPESTVAPVATISAASCQFKIRDFAVVRIPEKEAEDERNEEVWKVFVLLDNGNLHEATIKRDHDGKVSASAVIDPDQFIAIPKDASNMDSHSGAPSAPTDLSAQRVSLTYLEQSRVLLYETRSSGTLAMLVNEKGETKGAFELLPFEIPPAVLEKSDDCRVTGPYTHWRELGIVRRGSADYFRVSCAGKSSAASEPVLLCLEFNDSGAKVQELTKNSSGWFDPPQSYEGSAVFTVPLVCEDCDPLNLAAGRVFAERVILCALTLNGCLHIYAEDVASPARAALEPACSVESFQYGTDAAKKSSITTSHDPSLQLLAIESLTNVTESKELVFGADGLGK